MTVVPVLALMAICTGIGLRLLRWCSGELREVERLVLGFALGTGATASVILLASATLGFRSWVVMMVLAALAAGSWREWRALGGVALRAWSARKSLGGLGRVAGTIAGALLLLMLVQALAPPTDWDALMYHLRIPELWIARGSAYVPEDNLHVALVGLAHMLYVPLLMLGSREGPAVISLFCALVLGVSVYSMGRRLSSPDAGVLAVAGLAGTGLVVLTAVTPRVDIVFTLFAFLSAYALLLALDSTEARRLMRLSAALLGFAFGVKYFALPYAIAMAVPVAWVGWKTGQTTGDRTRILAEYAGVALLCSLPWLLKNLVLLGAPLYPLFAVPRVDPWIAGLTGSVGIPASIPEGALGVLEGARAHFSLSKLFLQPGLLTPESEGRWYILSPLLIYVPASLLTIRRRCLILAGIAIVFGALVAMRGAINLRYLLAAVPLCSVVAAIGMERALRAVLHGRSLALGMSIVACVSVIPGTVAIAEKVTRTGAALVASRTMSSTEYLHRGEDREVTNYIAMVDAVNQHLGSEARVIMLFEARGLYFEPEVLQDNVLRTWPTISSAATGGCLDASRATHVLLNSGALAYYAARGADTTALRWSLFEDFSGRCLESLVEQPGFTLYRLKRSAEPAR